MNFKNNLSLALRIIAGIILLQTLYFKFTGHAESVILFTKLGAEPWGRIGVGVLELFTAIFLVIPSTLFIGAILGTGIMIGAIVSHVTVLGIESNNDGGGLFLLAIVVLFCCLFTMILEREKGEKLFKKILRNTS